MYQKEIIYMSLFRDGVREKNAGYLKVSGCEETFRIELQVKNLPGAITGNFPIRLRRERKVERDRGGTNTSGRNNSV